MFLLPERAQPAPQVHELPVESRQLSGALRFGSQRGHVGRSADLLGSIGSGDLVSIDTEVLPSRIQLAPHARRGAVPMTESDWIPVLCVNDEAAKSGSTGIMIAYTEDMLSRERTMDCIMHYSLRESQ